MARIAFVTDSSADLTPEMRAGGRITVVRAPFAAVPGRAALPRDVEGHLKAAQPVLVDAFATIFTELASDHDAVVAVLLSSRLGGIVDAALQARERLAKVVPVEVVDSRSASLGLGFQVMRGVELAHQGMMAVEIAAALRAAIYRYHVVFSVESVEHLRETGQIGRSAAMIADGLHARTDGLTSLAVLVAVLGTYFGYPIVDPIIGLLIGVAILFITRDAMRTMWYRLMDAIDPAVVDQVEQAARTVAGVIAVHDTRVRWLGHRLQTELHIVVDEDLPTRESHEIAEQVRHALFHDQPHLSLVDVHVDPCGHGGEDPHMPTGHHPVATAYQTQRA